LTGIPGVAVVTAGPGVTNTITAMKNAQMAQSGTPGPVFIECPINLLYAEERVREWYGAKGYLLDKTEDIRRILQQAKESAKKALLLFTISPTLG
jgi:thiamine pyrophosphate-dependent acetolactate synthase large subunit-like protein